MATKPTTKPETKATEANVETNTEPQVDPRSIKLGQEQTLEFVNQDGDTTTRTYPSKSMAILDLHNEGMKTGDIAKLIGIRYQFAYNVINRQSTKAKK